MKYSLAFNMLGCTFLMRLKNGLAKSFGVI